MSCFIETFADIGRESGLENGSDSHNHLFLAVYACSVQCDPHQEAECIFPSYESRFALEVV